MSFGGILATALAGGAGVIGKQAGDDIADQRKAELLKQQADIEEQMRMRLAEFSEKQRRSGVLYDTTGEGGAAKREYRKGELADASDAAISQARNMIPVAVEQATAVAGAQRDAVTKSGSDPAYIKALRAISAANAAPDRTDYKGRELDNAIKQMQVDNAARVDGLRKEFGKATPERQQQIKDELSILTGKDADKFVPVPLKDADGAISGYQVFDTKSGKFVDAGAGKADPYAVPKGAAKTASGAALKPAAEPMIRTGLPQGPVAVAESELKQAAAALNTYGSSQRQRDPAGFRAAQQRVEDARAALAAIRESEAGPVTDGDRRPSIRYAAP